MQLIKDTLAALTIGAETTFKNLSVTPLIGRPGTPPDYLTLDEALKANVARVTEVSMAGVVPELRFENHADKAVLLLDGEELIGAKQNRILNLSVLVPAKSTITIPVSCVEAGRWSSVSAEFRSEERAYYAAGRARKALHVTESLRVSGTRHSRQGEIWDDIATKSARLGSHSDTAAMASIYQDQAGILDEYVDAIRPVPDQVGAIFAVNGRVRGLELFDYQETLGKLLAKVVRSYALDAIDESNLTPSTGASSVREFIERTKEAEATVFPALAEGEDVRLSGPNLSGGALVARSRVIHLCAFQLELPSQRMSSDKESALARASIRRRHFVRR